MQFQNKEPIKIKIQIELNSYQTEGIFNFCHNIILIEDKSEFFWEINMMALDYWTIEDYQRQWREGLERIKTNDTSCLIASIQDPSKCPWLNWWLLYKVKNKIFIQNRLFVSSLYIEFIGDKLFTTQTCYNFIPPRTIKAESGRKPSEWIIDFK